MSRPGDDASSNTGQASNSLTLGAGQETPRQVPQPASAVFQGQILQVLEKAFLHFDLDPRKDWVQCLEEIEIKTKRLDRWENHIGLFKPVSNEGIEVGIIQGKPVYAIIGEHALYNLYDMQGLPRYFTSPSEAMGDPEVPLSSIQRLVKGKNKADPNNRLHKFASIFENLIDQKYWFIILLATKKLLSDGKIREWRNRKYLSLYVRDLLYVKTEWEARESINGKPQGLPPRTAAQASSPGPPPPPANISPRPTVSQSSLPKEVRAPAAQQSPPVPSSSTVESQVPTPTAMNHTSEKAPTINSITEYVSLMIQYKKEQQDAQKENNDIKQQIAHHRQKLAEATAKLEPSVQKLKTAEKKRTSTIERTSVELKNQMLFRFEEVDGGMNGEENNAREDEDHSSKRPRTS